MSAKRSPSPPRYRLAVALAAVCLLAGCSTLGPASIRRDRTDYGDVLSSTWKEQTLLNIVKLRYGDAPVYLEVSSVISSSAMESQVSLGANWFSGYPTDGNSKNVIATGRYTDRPTISYTPLSGERFSRYLLRPLSPAAVFSLIQAGYPVDRVLQLTTRALNGVYNRSAAPSRVRAADPRFYPLIETLRRLQRSEALGMRIGPQGDDSSLMIVSRGVPENVARDSRSVRETLRLREGVDELTLTFGMVSRNDTELAVLTRSMAEIFSEVAATIEVPPQHIQEGRANPSPALPAQASAWDVPLVQIYSSASRPADAYAAVRYHDYWFWIDDRDMRSKTEFLFILVLFSLAETGVAAQAPVITVPAN